MPPEEDVSGDDDAGDDDSAWPEPGDPTAWFEALPPGGWAPLTVTFDGAGSTDPEGEIVAWTWDLDGDGATDAEGPVAQRVYPGPGSWTARLTVTDDDGLTATAEATITVQPDEVVELFAEPFDSDPFGTGRWTVYLGDCAELRPGTVEYVTSADGCGGGGGYITRGGAPRCVVHTGAPFSTEGYRELSLQAALRPDGGAASVETWTGGAWQTAGGVSGGGGWQSSALPLEGAHTGLLARLEHGGAVDCLSITGIPMSRPLQGRACPGGLATFSVSAVPGDGLEYRWYRDDVALADGDGISGVAEAQLLIEGAGDDHEGLYRCSITGASGTVWSNGSSLVVASAPEVSGQPLSVEATAGEEATFRVDAAGVGEVTYRWQRDGADLVDGDGVSGATTAALSVADVGPEDEGDYRCVVTDDCGTPTTSDEAHLYVRAWDGEVALVPGQQIAIGLHYESDWIIEADLLGCDAGGTFERYLQQEDRLDLFNRGDGNLALRFANRKIWFDSANVGGVSTPIGSTDHFGETLAGNVLYGDHALRIEYLGSRSLGRLYWDGALLGDWNLWIEEVPGPMGDVDVAHLAGGSLRWYQGDFVSLADY